MQRAKDFFGFYHSTLPFKYLGMPICLKSLYENECSALIEKMCIRIIIWSGRHFSYARRLQLFSSVLLSIHMYWVQVFELPKNVLKDTEKFAYLYYGMTPIMVGNLGKLSGEMFASLSLKVGWSSKML